MGLFNKLARMIIKAGATGPVSGGWAGGGYQDAWSTRPLPNPWQLLQQFKGDTYSCAVINAQAVASQVLRAYSTTSKNEKPTKNFATRELLPNQLDSVRKMCRDLPVIRKAQKIDELLDHPILDLLSRPNQFMDGFKLFELTDLYCEMTGVAYWYKERGALGIPEKLWLVPTTEIFPVRDQYGYTISYEAVRSKKAIPVEDIVFFSFPDLFAPYSRGKGPNQAAWGQTTLQDKTESFNHATMENRGRPDVFIVPKESMGEAEAARAELRFNRKYRRGGSGGAMVVEQAVDIKPAGFTNEDLEMFQLQELSKLNIANAFGVPISFLRTEDVNRANADAGHYQHAKLAIRPRCLRFTGVLNLQLTSDFDNRIVLAYDDPVPADIDQGIKVRESNLNAGYTNINEEREKQGLVPVEWGDLPWIPVNKMQPLTKEEKLAETAAREAEAEANLANPKVDTEVDGPIKAILDYYCKGVTCEDKGISKKWFNKYRISESKTIIEKCGTLSTGWKAEGDHHSRLLPTGDRLKAELKRVFREQQRVILKSILGKSLKAIKVLIPTDINLSSWTKTMFDSALPIITMFFEDGGQGLDARLGLDDKFDVTSPKVAEACKQLTLKFCEETNVATSLELNDALERLRERLAATLLSSENTVQELVKTVSAVFDKASMYRASTIAMSESSRALHAGQIIAAKQSGLKIKIKWLCSQDACDECQGLADENQGGVDPGENFGTIGSGPYSDIPYPPAHPRCQCTITEEVIGEKE